MTSRLPLLALLLASSQVAAGKPPAPSTADLEACAQAFEQGQEQRQKGALLEARDTFGRCARPLCPRTLQTSCARWQGEVAAEIPKIRVEVEGGEAAEVLLDGAPVGRAPLSIDVAPGTHQMVARSARGDGPPLRVDASPKASLSVSLAPFRPAPSAPALPPSAPASTPTPTPSRALPVSLMVAGGLVLGAGAWLGASSYFKARQLRDDCAPRCASADVDSVRGRLRLGDVLMGVGGVALGAGVYLFVSDRSRVSAAVSSSGARLDAAFSF